jgi:hypothetical protein
MDQEASQVSRREALGSIVATVAGLSALRMPSNVLAEEAVAVEQRLSRDQRKLNSLLERAPGGSGVDKEFYLRNVGRGEEGIRFFYDISDVSSMSAEQVERILKFTEYVWSPKIRADMWLQVQEDLSDRQSEKGGLIVDNGTRPFIGIRSDVERELNYVNKLGLRVSHLGNKNTSYRMPQEVVESIPHIGEYHLHATKPEGEPERHYGPSGGRSRLSINGYSGDLGHVAYRIEKFGASHQLVVTLSKAATDEPMAHQPKVQPGSQAMNFHYFGGEKGGDGVIRVFVCNLGTFYNTAHYKVD